MTEACECGEPVCSERLPDYTALLISVETSVRSGRVAPDQFQFMMHNNIKPQDDVLSGSSDERFE